MVVFLLDKISDINSKDDVKLNILTFVFDIILFFNVCELNLYPKFT